MKLSQVFIVLLSLAGNVLAGSVPEAEILFGEAQISYVAEEYELALQKAQQAVALEPDNSEYHHLLGKCYGRLAATSNFIKAVPLSKKTLQALERAVELDNNNINALKDLMEYYRRAPGFLGGDKKKADEIEQLLSTFNLPNVTG